MIFSESEKNCISSGGSLHSFMGSCGQKHMDIEGNTYDFGVLLKLLGEGLLIAEREGAWWIGQVKLLI